MTLTNADMLLTLILLPCIAGLVLLVWRRALAGASGMVAFLISLINLLVASSLFMDCSVRRGTAGFSLDWGGYGLALVLKLAHFNSFIILAAAGFSILVALYSLHFMKDRKYASQFYGYMLISLGMTNGAAAADHLITLLFFWEGLLAVLFGMISVGNRTAFKTATKMFVIVGVTDLCMMLGMIIAGKLAGTFVISEIEAEPIHITLLGGIAMTLMMVGAVSKAGSMPFHSWIPDAASDAPLPFMAFMPASLEKLLGIYFLARITMDIFKLEHGTGMSYSIMTLGAATIIFAVMMALIQKDYKRLLSYHAISQVGYMILGVGSAIPIGIVGGIFHMINHAMYKSCLFLTAGSVEKQTGTTDLAKLGGIGAKMPVTFACFIVAAASISGVPPFNGFFSKELVYDAALETNTLFYIAAVMGSFLTAASFLKLGHAAFLGRCQAHNSAVREAPPSMLAPMIVIAGACVLFGVWNALPLQCLIEPILGDKMEVVTYAGFPKDAALVILTCVALLGALFNHLAGVKAYGSGLHAVDHIHHAPVLEKAYERAERYWDPYDIYMKCADILSKALWLIDRAVDWFYDVFSTRLFSEASRRIRLAHTGDYADYLLWALAGAVAVLVMMIKFL